MAGISALFEDETHDGVRISVPVFGRLGAQSSQRECSCSQLTPLITVYRSRRGRKRAQRRQACCRRSPLYEHVMEPSVRLTLCQRLVEGFFVVQVPLKCLRKQRGGGEGPQRAGESDRVKGRNVEYVGGGGQYSVLFLWTDSSSSR